MKTLLLLMASAAAAQPAQQPEEELAQAVERALRETYQTGALAGTALSLHRPAQRRVELGAVVDVRPNEDGGLPVLAITPKGFAERVGLREGDRLVAINAIEVADAASLRTAIGQAADRDQMTVDIVRDGAKQQLVGATDVRDLPAFTLSIAPTPVADADGCGFVSGGARRNNELMRVEIETVNGQQVDPDLMGRVQLPAGRHRLVVRPVVRVLPPSPAPSYPTQFPYNEPSRDTRISPNSQRVLPGARYLGEEIVVDLVVRTDRVHRLGASALSDGSWLIVEDKTSERRCIE